MFESHLLQCSIRALAPRVFAFVALVALAGCATPPPPAPSPADRWRADLDAYRDRARTLAADLESARLDLALKRLQFALDAGADAASGAALEIRAPQPLVPAAYRHTPLPPYPAAAREQRLEGVVVLSVLVGMSGGVVEVSVARKWTFVPARRGSRAVESVVEVPVKFALSRE